MKSILKRAMLVLGAMAVTVAVGACGNKSDDATKPGVDVKPEVTVEKPVDTLKEDEEAEIRLSWWGGDSRHEATLEAAKLFTDAHPNIKVETEYGAWTGWEEKLALQFSQGNAADLTQINWSWTESYNSDGDTFYDLNQLTDIIDLSQFDPDALEDCTIDGKLLAVPISMTGRLYYWNKTTWERAGLEVPKTWDEFVNAGEVFRTELGEEYFPFYLGEYDRMIFMVHWLQDKYGMNWIENGEIQYTEEQIQEGFAMIKELEDKHVMPTLKESKELGIDAIEQSQQWIDGYFGGTHTWDTASGKVKDALVGSTNIPNQEFVVGDFLTGIGDFKGGFTKISMAFAISGNTKHPEKAAKLLQFLLAEEEGVVAMGDARGVPVNKAGMQIAAEKELVSPIALEASRAVLGHNSFTLDTTFEDAGLRANPDGIYYVAFENHSYGNYDDAKAAAELVKGINDFLAKQ